MPLIHKASTNMATKWTHSLESGVKMKCRRVKPAKGCRFLEKLMQLDN